MKGKCDMIRKKRMVQLCLLHVSLICSLIILVAGILDWYNPFMNFSGQFRIASYVQTAVLLILVLTGGKTEKRYRIGRKGGNTQSDDKRIEYYEKTDRFPRS